MSDPPRFAHLLVFFCTVRYGEKQQEALEISIYVMKGFKASSECVHADFLDT